MIEVEGLRIAYHRAGVGPPLMLLHGYVGDGPTSWRRQIEALADEFTVVAWDAPGAGGSSDPPEGFGMAGYADCLAGFIAGLGLERPHVAGLSFGGALAPVVLLVAGLLLAGSDADLSQAIGFDPIGALGTLLPTWFLVPFILVVVLGLIAIAFLKVFLPETKDRSLEELEDRFAAGQFK